MDDIGVERSIGIADKCIEISSDEFCEKTSSAEVCSVNDGAEKVETLNFLEQKKSNEMNIEKCCEEVVVEKCFPSDEGVKLGSLVDFVHETSDIGVVEKCVEIGGQEVEKIDSKEVRFSVEEELSKVSLNHELNYSNMAGAGDEASLEETDMIDTGVQQSAEILNVDGDGGGGGKEEVRSDKVESGSESETESESESESSGSSSSSSSDTSSDEDDDDKDESEEEEEPKAKADITGIETETEEGEITLFEANEMVAWSDDDEDDAGGNAMKGPIRSKNEIADLPLVPTVNVSLQLHHHTLPVGIILSILGPQVIVEGIEKHNPLNEGSILWITESRSPLGVVDEIFGPVKNPYYIVRYNSETEVPAGVQQGTQISFVAEFADHVLNNANLYRKGYDASGEHDEELSEEAEFSDDEKEAEYRKMQKMKKRGTNDNKGEDRKKDKRKSKNQFGVGKHEQSSAHQTHDFANNVSTQNFVQPPGVGFGVRKNEQSAANQTHDFANSVSTQNFVQPPGLGFPINPQMQGMPWLQGNHPQPVVQSPFLNMAPFQQNMQMNPSLAFAPFPGGVSLNFLNQSLLGMAMQENALNMTNFGANAGSFSGLQHGGVAQNFLNQSILGMCMQNQNAGMCMQNQNASTPTNVGANAVSSNGFQQMATSNPGQDGFQNSNPGNPGQDGFQNFNPGTHRGGGRTYRGGGRGRRQS